MTNTIETLNQLEREPGAGAYVARGPRGAKVLTLAYSPRRACYRYFRGPRPGGGGRKHAKCSRVAAADLIEQFPGGRIDRR